MIALTIDVDDVATPILARLLPELTDPTEFHKFLALDVAEHTRRHIRLAARSRHTVSQRLGSAPTGYLTRAAETVESNGDRQGVELRVAGAIFKRVSGPVLVRPRAKKYLTIPIHKDAVGRKAEELWWPKPAPKRPPRPGSRRRLIQGLVFIRSRKGNLLLARPMPDGSIIPYYSLKTSVILPQDPGLLPTGEQLGQVAEKTAQWYVNRRLRQAGLA